MPIHPDMQAGATSTGMHHAQLAIKQLTSSTEAVTGTQHPLALISLFPGVCSAPTCDAALRRFA
jgi:hypothetical protein